jgi:hypothetical protein
MAIVITIRIDVEKPADREPSLERIGRELAREAGLTMRLLPRQYALIGADFSRSVHEALERWISEGINRGRLPC